MLEISPNDLVDLLKCASQDDLVDALRADNAAYARRNSELESELRLLRESAGNRGDQSKQAIKELIDAAGVTPRNKIQAIKAARTLTGLDLKDSKDLVESTSTFWYRG